MQTFSDFFFLISGTSPTTEPTNKPSTSPTTQPTNEPTFVPTELPTFEPTESPTIGMSDNCLASEVWSIEYNGLWWAWASPCSGGCSDASGDNYAGSIGWRFASIQEWDDKPARELFFDGEKCAAFVFDDTFTHCDWNNEVVRTNELQGVDDLWLVIHRFNIFQKKKKEFD